ncbi:MAG TPA: adenylate/guanylate cyclase domain-containing protein, partial [Acidimicrobiales bacterium]|nr:adenylate/guanylate cyclase domain-containing protein [Acidimicrobiales bacterium]
GPIGVTYRLREVDEDAQRWARLGWYEEAATGSEDRLAVLRYLTGRGATDDDLARNIGDLPALVNELRLRRPRLSLEEVAERSGLTIDVAELVARAAGFVLHRDGEQFVASDVEVFELARSAVEMFGLEPTLQFTRVTASALAQIADAAMTNFGQNVAPALEARHAGELAVAEATDAATGLLLVGVPAILNSLFFHACETAVRRVVTSGASVTSDLTVGFLDLVGSTALAERLGAEELGALISTFEREAAEVVADADGRVVKMIGDEVMFVVSDAFAACRVALELARRVEEHPALPLLRGALASGDLVRGYGDYYGPVVNGAARAVKLAEPGTILATEGVRQRTDSAAIDFEPFGERHLRGIDRPVRLFRLNRSQPGDAPGDPSPQEGA